jgi:hypothetical protein
MVIAMSNRTWTKRGAMRDTILTSRRARLALWLVLFSLVPILGFAATRGPDAGGYTGTDSTVYSFVDLAGAGGAASILAGTDDGTAVLTLPFAFRFYGVDYTQVCVSTNGALYFITSSSACVGIVDFANTDLTSTVPPGDLPAVFPFWSDLTFQVAGAGAVLYQTTGAPGARKFVVQWDRAYPQDSQNPVTFQAILSEGTNGVLFQYKEVGLDNGDAASKGGEATVGIRNIGAPANLRQIAWSFDAHVISNESALLFGPSSSVPPVITVTGGTFTFDGQPHAAIAVAAGTGGTTVSGSFAFAYTPGGSTAPVNAGTYSVLATFTSADPGYSNATGTATITINKATPIITWSNPAPITEGTALGAAQLNATVNAPGTLAYTPPAGTVLNDGPATLTVSFAPTNPANFNTATRSVSLTVQPTAGEMTGGGHTDVAGVRHEFSFYVRERRSGSEGGYLRLEVERVGRETRANQIGTFVSTSVDSVVFSDNPAFRPSRFAPKPTVDTATMSGVGRWNGAPGYLFSAEALDAGEPGAGRDRFAITIRSPQGSIVATVTGTISAGNIQSNRLER